MAELTTEYLDKKLEGLATKADLEQQTKDLKAHAESLQAELAGMIERSVNVSQRVEKVESDIRAIKQALHL
jgi:phage shock protein A